MVNSNVDKLIKIAKQEVGYIEKKSNKDLNHKTENAGNKNYTKYARDYNKFANANLQANPWCDMFLDWLFVQAFGVEKAKELLGGFSAYTPTSAQYFKNMKRWYKNKPQIGDVIFFKNSERIHHTGIVIDVDDSRIYTIEGNTSGSNNVVVENGGGVFEKNYLLTNSRVAGYGRPNYDSENINDLYHYIVKGDTLYKLSKRYNMTVKELKSLNNLKSNTIYVGDKLKIKDDWVARLQKLIGAKVDNVAGKETLSKTPTIKKGVKGEVVKLLQERLQDKYGISVGKYGADGSCGGDTVKAINEFQRKYTGLRKHDSEFTSGGLSWQTILGLR